MRRSKIGLYLMFFGRPCLWILHQIAPGSRRTVSHPILVMEISQKPRGELESGCNGIMQAAVNLNVIVTSILGNLVQI